MNHQENFPKKPDPELEARIVAWVLGEASPFEIAELTRHLADNPELEIFKRRIEAVHGLVGEAVRPVKEPLVMSPDRRARLLAAIGAAAPEKNETPVTVAPVAAQKSVSRSTGRRGFPAWLLPAAACVTVGLLSVLVLKPLVTPEARDAAPLEMRVAKRAEETVSREDAPSSGRGILLRNEDEGPVAEKPLVFQSAPALKEKASSMDAYNGQVGRARAAQVPSQARQPAAAPAGQAAPRSFFGGGGRAPAAPSSVGGIVGPAAAPRVETENKDAFAPGGQARQESLTDTNANSAETVRLSPFTVSSDTDKGYSAANTLSGARVNSNLEDRASTITVVTKQQLLDTAALDINDRFRFEDRSGREADLPVARPAPAPVDDTLRAELPAREQPVSTFSLHVSDVSFRLAKAALDRGQRPDAASIRPEEFYNAFDYGDPAPAAGEAVACRIEQAAHPFLQQRNLVRIAMKVPGSGRAAGQALRLTILVDTSGSMERADRVATLRRAIEVLASLLGPNDRVTLIGFARQPRLLADGIAGDKAASLVDIVGRTPAEGGTNLEEALKLAGERARAQFTAGAQNRIVVLTDGAANLGADDPARLATLVETLRQQSIAFDACGVGAEGIDDSMLEALTRRGDGRYYVINSPAEADAGFARQLAGAFRPAAENVKVQVQFNPARVRSYRLIGFEQHRLRTEDFRNDQVDAAELAAEEAAVALYQVEVIPEGEGELGEVSVRFRRAGTTEMLERQWTLSYAARVPAFDRASASLQLAGTAAFVAEKLRGGPAAAPIRLAELAPVVNALRAHYASQPRVQEFVAMFGQVRRIVGE
jgi:Mg-chelatase subunit ChlD